MNREGLVVIGIGHEGRSGLSSEALEHISRAQVLAGGQRHLGFFPEWRGKKIVIDADLEKALSRLKDSYRQEKTVLLASGDPLFYGIGRLLLKKFPREDLLFLPHLSSVQLAFARIKEPWDDAQIVSLHGRPLSLLLPPLHKGIPKIAVLTDAQNHPAAIARFLIEQGFDHYSLWVCEELGGPKERVTQWPLQEIHQQSFSPLNIVLLLRNEQPMKKGFPLLGIPEEVLLSGSEKQRMITKRNVRLLSLCALELYPHDTVWDVGAGSGSIALEAARLSSTLHIFALEKSELAFRQIEENVHRLGLTNISPVWGEAPEIFRKIPDPDAVFIGGSGGKLEEILSVAGKRLKPGGRMVLNCITLEKFALGWRLLTEQGLEVETTSVQLAHSKPIGTLHRLQPENPIFILRGKKR